ncbi:MAG: polysaccharide biosynthesis/export family protein [Candidatus Omnitrophota bacterium]
MFKKNGLHKSILMLLAVSALISNSGCARFSKPTRPLEYSTYAPEGTITEKGEYVIGVRDELDISVWRCPELESAVTVRPETGKITLPLIGHVKAIGLTPRELAKAISKKMAFYVKDPRVAVGVRKIGDKKVFLLGQVLKQGAYRLERGDRVINLITLAGGFTKDAVPSCTHIVRGGYEGSEIIRVNLSRLIHNADISQNVYLKEGDIVFVPESEIAQYNFVLQKIFPSMFFADKLADLKVDIMDGQFDWHDLWVKAAGDHNR